MGLTFTDLEISSDRGTSKKQRLQLLIDSGAEYSVVPREQLEVLGIKPYRTVRICLADGSLLERDAGDAFFHYQGEHAPSPVIFGEKDDEALLGVVTLETLGFMLDPLSRRIIKRKILRG